jgi:hypothetical protein
MPVGNYGFSNNVQVIPWDNLPDTLVIANLWGGGGGAGGNDARAIGGNGGGGCYSQVIFTVGTGDELYVAVGGGGGRGQSSASNAAGGGAGAAFTGSTVFSTLELLGSGVIRRSHPWYSTFLNSNGVWYNYAASVFDFTVTRNFPTTSEYTFTVSADNYGEIYLDGTLVVATPTGNTTAAFTNTYSARVTVAAGNHNIRVLGTNAGDVAAIGATVAGEFSYSGGRGGNAGARGTSGGGGGGGGATVLLRNTTVMAVAGGGGGGGGAGISGGGPANAPGSRGFAGTGQFAGQNGQDKSGDGGGSGGGGGGFRGGQGGANPGGDVYGTAGYFGDNYAPDWDEPGTSSFPIGINPPAARSNTAGVRPGSAGLGGVQSAGNGGAITLDFYFNATRIKDSNFFGWRSVGSIWIKADGTWKSVETGYLKHNNQWIVTLPSNNTVPISTAIPGVFGVNSRPFS